MLEENGTLEKNSTLDEDRKEPQYRIGIERETLRCTMDGKLALTGHPESLGDKIENPYITVDFSESQPEIITKVSDSVEECYKFLEKQTDRLIKGCKERNEYIWPQSMPCLLPREEDIPIAIYGENGQKERIYREMLAKKYSKKMQMICGVHFNFSLSDTFFEKLNTHNENFRKFKDRLYMKAARNYLRYHWMIIYLTGATPMRYQQEEDTYETCLISFRNSQSGYANNSNIVVDYTTLDDYVDSIKSMIDKGIVISEKEVYAPVRLKRGIDAHTFADLKNSGVEYIEIRSLDVNMFDKCGIDKETLYFMTAFMFYCMLGPENELSIEDNRLERVALMGIDEHMKSIGIQVIDEIQDMNTKYHICNPEIIKKIKCRFYDYKETTAYKMTEVFNHDGFIPGTLKHLFS